MAAGKCTLFELMKSNRPQRSVRACFVSPILGPHSGSQGRFVGHSQHCDTSVASPSSVESSSHMLFQRQESSRSGQNAISRTRESFFTGSAGSRFLPNVRYLCSASVGRSFKIQDRGVGMVVRATAEKDVSSFSSFKSTLLGNVRSLTADITANVQQTCNVLVFGGSGQLGRAVIDKFRTSGFPSFAADRSANDAADGTILLQNAPWADQAAALLRDLDASFGSRKFKAVICVAGGWAGGNIADEGVFAATEGMWSASVQSAVLAGHVAAKYLDENGLLIFTGSAASFKGTPGMVGYGLSKAAVHQLTESLGAEGSGLPEGTTVIGIVPVVLDTPSNRAGNPGGNYDDWTPLEDVTALLYSWTTNKASRPPSGSLVEIVTKNRETETRVVNLIGQPR